MNKPTTTPDVPRLYVGIKEAMYMLDIDDRRTMNKVIPYTKHWRRENNAYVFKVKELEKGYEKYLDKINQI